jgi:streptogramin lyase
MRHHPFVAVALVAVAITSAATIAHAAVQSLAVGATVAVPSQFRTLGIASGAGAVWATDGTATLTRVDPTSQSVVASIPVPDADIVLSDAGDVWVVSSNGLAYRIDPQTNTVAAKTHVATNATGAAIGDGALWVAGRLASAITRVNITTGKVARVPTPESPRYVTVGAGAVWAASNDSPTIWRINPANNKVTATISLTDTPHGIIATPTGVFVLGGTNNRIVRINPHTNKIAGFTPIPKTDGFIGYGGAIAAAAGSVWVTTLTHLLQLDPRSGHILAAVAVGTHPSHDPVGLTAVSSGPAGLWVADGDGKTIAEITHS